jgi:hypothetical protein
MIWDRRDGLSSKNPWCTSLANSPETSIKSYGRIHLESQQRQENCHKIPSEASDPGVLRGTSYSTVVLVPIDQKTDPHDVKKPHALKSHFLPGLTRRGRDLGWSRAHPHRSEALRRPWLAPTFLPHSSLAQGRGRDALAACCHGYRAEDGESAR